MQVSCHFFSLGKTEISRHVFFPSSAVAALPVVGLHENIRAVATRLKPGFSDPVSKRTVPKSRQYRVLTSCLVKETWAAGVESQLRFKERLYPTGILSVAGAMYGSDVSFSCVYSRHIMCGFLVSGTTGQLGVLKRLLAEEPLAETQEFRFIRRTFHSNYCIGAAYVLSEYGAYADIFRLLITCQG